MDNLAKKQCGLKENRASVITDIQNIQAHKRLSSIPRTQLKRFTDVSRNDLKDIKITSIPGVTSEDSLAIESTPFGARTARHNARRGSVPFGQARLSPLNNTRNGGFISPDRTSERSPEGLVRDDTLRYLNSYKNTKKENVREFVASSRKILQTNLVTEDRDKEIIDITTRYESEKEKLGIARDVFEEDL